MTRLLLMTLTLGALAASASSQSRIHVDLQVRMPGNGATWSSAFRDLAAALSVATSGDEVWVAGGSIYSGSFTVPAGVTVLGGFHPGDLRPTQRDQIQNPSFLDGRGARVLTLNTGAVVDGFVVQNGAASTGAGALVQGTGVVLRNCNFQSNSAGSGQGSGVFAGNGAAVRIESCGFGQNGNGMVVGGGALELVGAQALVLNCLFAGNFNDGIQCTQGAVVRVHDTILFRNLHRGLVEDGTAAMQVTHDLFFGNGGPYRQAGVDLTVAQLNALGFANANLAADPMFQDPLNGDFRLQPGSPAIDAGLPNSQLTAVQPAPWDPAGSSRLLDGDQDGALRVDIGVFEFTTVFLQDAMSNPTPGGNIRLQLFGMPGTVTLLALGVVPADPPFLATPVGFIGLAPSGLAGVATVGALPATVNIALPPSLLPSPALFQAFAVLPGGIQSSSVVDLQVQ